MLNINTKVCARGTVENLTAKFFTKVEFVTSLLLFLRNVENTHFLNHLKILTKNMNFFISKIMHVAVS